MQLRDESRHVYRLMVTLVILFFGSVATMSVINIFSENPEKSFIAFALVYASLAFLLISFIVLKLRSKKVFLIILVAVAFAVRLIWILSVSTVVESDYILMYDSALKGAVGNFSFSSNSYYLQWAYQMGFTLYQSLIISVFGKDTFVLKLINCMISTGTTILVYKIAEAVFNEKAGRAASVLYALYLPTVIVNSVLTNQILAAFLFYLAFYLFLTDEQGRIYIYFFVGALFAMGQFIRPLAMFVLPCFVLYELIEFVIKKEKRRIFGILITLTAYFVLMALAGNILVFQKISPYGLENREPYWKFVIGLNSETTGQYSDEDASYVQKFALGEDRNKAELEMIRERTEHKQQLLLLMLNKYSEMWGTRDSTVYWSANVDVKNLMKNVGAYEQAMYIVLCFLAFIATFALFWQRNNKLYFIMILLLLYMAVHLFIEIQTRYRDFVLPVILVFAGYGVYLLMEPKQRRENRKTAI